MSLPLLILTVAALSVSASSLADTLYSSMKLANQSVAALTWNAYGAGFITDQNSIQFASPFTTPNVYATVTSVRIAAGIESGENSFILLVYSSAAGLPKTLIAETTVTDLLLPVRAGDPVDHWIDVALSVAVDLRPQTTYWISLKSKPGSVTFLHWQQPNTDVEITNAYRNSTFNGTWLLMQPYSPAAFEITGTTTLVPEPSTINLVLIGVLLVGIKTRLFANTATLPLG